MACNKCKQAARFQSDSWCLSCSAWEQLGQELCLGWPSPGGRLLACDLVVSTLRQVRALRRLSSAGAGSRLASGSGGHRTAEGERVRTGADPPPEPANPPGLKAAAKSGAAGPREDKAKSIAEEEDESSGSEEASSPKEVRECAPLSRTRREDKDKAEALQG